jgi:hypothetical protein
MRPLAILATALTCAAASAAGAQSLSEQAILNGAAFAPVTDSTQVDPVSRLIEREGYRPGAGPVRWTGSQVQLSPDGAGGPVDSLRVSVGGVLRTPAGAPLNLRAAQYDAEAYEVALTRDWPSAFAYQTGPLGIDVTPHAGLGMTSFGGSAEAGATLRVMHRDDIAKERLRALGVRDGSSFGERGRWYLFAAASGRAVGLNMLHGDQGWDRAGWTTDATSTLTGDAQVGVGWRKGDMQTSLGYIHREMKGQNVLWGVDAKQDSMVAFSLSIRPHR